MIVTGVPAILLVLVAATTVFPQVLSTKEWIPWVVIPSAAVLYFPAQRLQRYAQTPEIAAAFASPASRRLTMAVYLAVLLGSILAAAALTHVLRR
jgi:hypothetical protein